MFMSSYSSFVPYALCIDFFSVPTRRSSDLRFTLSTPQKFIIAKNDNRLCGVVVDIHKEKGSTVKIEPVLFPEFKNERSEEHTSELQSRGHLVCRLLLEKKKVHRVLLTYR